MNRFPVCFQHDSMLCGITCLQMICRYFGREYSLDSLTKICCNNGRCFHAGHQRGGKNIGISNGFGKGYNSGTERDSTSMHPSLEPEPLRGII